MRFNLASLPISLQPVPTTYAILCPWFCVSSPQTSGACKYLQVLLLILVIRGFFSQSNSQSVQGNKERERVLGRLLLNEVAIKNCLQIKKTESWQNRQSK